MADINREGTNFNVEAAREQPNVEAFIEAHRGSIKGLPDWETEERALRQVYAQMVPSVTPPPKKATTK